MNAKILLMILTSVSCSAFAQMAFKAGMSRAEVQRALAGPSTPVVKAGVILANPYVLGGFGLYALSAALWLVVLSKVDVSFAYPFVGLGFVLTMLGGCFFMGEALGWMRVLGTVLVIGGVVLVSRS